MVWRKERLYFGQMCCVSFLTQMTRESFLGIVGIHAWTRLPLGQYVPGMSGNKAKSSSAQESWAKSCSRFFREVLGFGYMGKLP